MISFIKSIVGRFKAQFYFGKGCRIRDNGNIEDAAKLFELAYTYSKNTNQNAVIATISEALSSVLFELKDYNKANKFALEAIKFYNILIEDSKNDSMSLARDRLNQVQKMYDYYSKLTKQ